MDMNRCEGQAAADDRTEARRPCSVERHPMPLNKRKLYPRKEGDKAVVAPRHDEVPALAASDIASISPQIAMNEQYLLLA
jgi:hypothetical protein